ncbi:hypothetical protein H9Q72_005309 [Fusarium xylarioides]|uniref:FAD-binding domain-containing protein n=1 Tax=Fusarium xylarioides TaxID=221167 RepID=A0A9P7HVJ6_9HYPO|nr:hypothetical protein H9Q72_005309 [Fusarium xylarioides]
MQENTYFKVIVVGARVTGLTLAHCLAKAGIDWFLLNKGAVAPRFGTTITLQPHGCRILHQLGCLDAVLAKCDTMGGAHCRDPTGNSFASNDFFGVACVKDIIEENSIARVILADGLRGIMWDKANALHPGMITVDEKRDTVVFGELWKRRLKAQMISLEEGVLEHWTSGRIVLAGDAVHKVTPNSALGGNTTMGDAVVITNTLHALLSRHPNEKPSDLELHDAIRQEHQGTRVERARAIVKAGGVLTRQQAYDEWKAYITQRWLTPIIELDTLAQKISGVCVTAPKLSFVEFEERRGILGWQDKMEAEKEHAMKGKVSKKGETGISWDNWNGGFEAVLSHVMGIVAALWLAMGISS